jgi:hypothetical protein
VERVKKALGILSKPKSEAIEQFTASKGKKITNIF